MGVFALPVVHARYLGGTIRHKAKLSDRYFENLEPPGAAFLLSAWDAALTGLLIEHTSLQTLCRAAQKTF